MYKTIAIYLLIIYLIFASPAYALNPGSYLFRFKNPQITTQSATTVSQTPPPVSDFEFKAGFPEFTTISDFNLTISHISLDFGILTPEIPHQLTNTLSVSAPQTHGYSLLAHQNHPLQLASTITIPDLTSANDYGFGYSLDQAKTWQTFADQSQAQPPQTIFASIIDTPLTLPLTYQLKIPSTQAAGDYENTIFFLAIPSY